MKHVRPPPQKPDKGTIFQLDAEGRRTCLHWFDDRTWMELCPLTCRVKCWVCRSQFQKLSNKESLTSKNQDTIATVGYEGNKHMLKKLHDHENSKLHVLCMEMHANFVANKQSTRCELDRQQKIKQQENRKYFLTIVMGMQYFCKQNIPLRGENNKKK